MVLKGDSSLLCRLAGKASFALGDNESAEEAFEKATELDAVALPAWEGKAETEVMENNLGKAVETYRKLVRLIVVTSQSSCDTPPPPPPFSRSRASTSLRPTDTGVGLTNISHWSDQLMPSASQCSAMTLVSVSFSSHSHPRHATADALWRLGWFTPSLAVGGDASAMRTTTLSVPCEAPLHGLPPAAQACEGPNQTCRDHSEDPLARVLSRRRLTPHACAAAAGQGPRARTRGQR